jgi:hypothetical protein
LIPFHLYWNFCLVSKPTKSSRILTKYLLHQLYSRTKGPLCYPIFLHTNEHRSFPTNLWTFSACLVTSTESRKKKSACSRHDVEDAQADADLGEEPHEVNLLSKMEVYAVISLSGDPRSRQRIIASTRCAAPRVALAHCFVASHRRLLDCQPRLGLGLGF